MRAPAHPDRLLWYTSGRIDPQEAREIEEHLAHCIECRDEAAALSSMRGTLARRRGTEHVQAIDLAAFGSPDARLSRHRRGAIEAHVQACAACREDLAQLGAGGPPARPENEPALAHGSARGKPRPVRRWGILAAIVLLGVAAAALWGSRRAPIESVTFLSPQRGGSGEPRLAGVGPWSITVVLPFEAPEGDYQVEVRSEEDSLVRRLDESAQRDADGRLDLLLDTLSGPARYRLLARPAQPAGGAAYEYSFEVLGSASPDRRDSP